MGTIYRDYGARWAPRLATYYLADGLEDRPSNWKFVNESMWDCFDTNHNLVSFYDGGVNTQSIEFSSESVAIERIDLSSIQLSYTKSTRQVTLNNIPVHSSVYVMGIAGNQISCYRSGDNNVSFTLDMHGVVLVSVVDENNLVQKTFKVLL